jgi:gliding motility-associated-like protein
VCATAPYIYQNIPLSVDYATVENNSRVKLKWAAGIQPNVKEYILDRKAGSNVWQNDFAITADTFLIDNAANVNAQAYAYRVRTRDDCGYESPVSLIGQTIYLQSRIIDDHVVLNWNKYREWVDGVDHYELYVRKRDGSFGMSAVIAPNDSVFTDDSIYTEIDTTYCYRVVAVQKNAAQNVSVSNITCALLDSRIFIPNAFSPNKDSINDVWKVSSVSIYNQVGKESMNYHVRIVNRWGQVVFESSNVYEGWDGTTNGKQAPPDVYVYQLHASGIDGRSINRTGTITLMK